MGTIRLYQAADVWMADFSGAHDAAEIRDLFGTTALPTPYSARILSSVVQDAVRRKNPGYRVLVALPEAK
jgi:hypothetical protein